jgi:hypothetical protein
MIHELKCWPEPFEEMRLGVKVFEVRREDAKRFNGGDVLRLREFDPMRRAYTNRGLDVQVLSVLRLHETPDAWGIRAHFVAVMGVKVLRSFDVVMG